MPANPASAVDVEMSRDGRRRRPVPPGPCAVWGAYLTVMGWSLLHTLRRPPTDRMADLDVYVGAVRALAAGRPLYGYVAPSGGPFTYPPFAAFLLAPLRWPPVPVTRLLWTAVTAAAVAGIAVAMARWVPPRWRHRRAVLAPATAILLAVSAPVLSNVRFGQVSVPLAAIVLLDASDRLSGRLRGSLVGLAAAVKLTPLLFVVHAATRGHPRHALRASAWFAGCTGLAALVLPGESRRYWTGLVLRTSRIGDLAATGNQSVYGVLSRLELTGAARTGTWLAVAGAVAAAGLWRARRLARAGRPGHAAVVVGCATVAASPVSWTHHQIWLVLAGVLLAVERGRPGFAGLLLLGVMTLPVAVLAQVTPHGLDLVVANSRALAAIVVCCLGLPGAPPGGTGRTGERVPRHDADPAGSRPAADRAGELAGLR